ncbi:MAG TPA: hypothetical protein VFF64_03440 [Candidatus Eremiobacteraceae bacterium]|nr:hypothetical protein [Candidatus Eremiobacteraceae bacterium]
MRDEKALQVFLLTLQKTVDGEVSWRRLDNQEMDDVFEYDTAGGFNLRVFPHSTYDQDNPDGAGPPSLTIYDSSNQMVFDVTSELDGVALRDLDALYLKARSVALGIDDKLELVLRDLKALPVRSQ